MVCYQSDRLPAMYALSGEPPGTRSAGQRLCSGWAFPVNSDTAVTARHRPTALSAVSRCLTLTGIPSSASRGQLSGLIVSEHP
jgi:hypothetical protein